MITKKKLALAGLVAALVAGPAIAQLPEQQPPGQPPQGQVPQGQPPQGQPPQGQPPFGQQESVEISDEDLQSFAEVQPDLQQIRIEYSTRLEQAEDQAAAAALQQEASDEMVAALEDNGLDVETYTLIAQVVQVNPELRERLQEMLQ